MTVSLVHVIYTSKRDSLNHSLVQWLHCQREAERKGIKTAGQQAMIPGSMLSSSLDTRPRGGGEGEGGHKLLCNFLLFFFLCMVMTLCV